MRRLAVQEADALQRNAQAEHGTGLSGEILGRLQICDEEVVGADSVADPPVFYEAPAKQLLFHMFHNELCFLHPFFKGFEKKSVRSKALENAEQLLFALERFIESRALSPENLQGFYEKVGRRIVSRCFDPKIKLLGKALNLHKVGYL